MADQNETVTIRVTETGAAEVSQALTSVGTAGAQAGADVAKGMAVASDGLTAAQRGALAASSAYGAFATQLAQVTQAASQAAKGAIDLGEAHTVSAEAAKANAAAQEALVAGARAATEAMVAEAAAGIEAAASLEKAGNAAAVAGDKAEFSATSFKKMNGAFAGFAAVLGVVEFAKFSDAATTLDNTIKHITTSTGDYDQVLQSLSATANRTGTPINDLSKLMFSLDVAVKGTGVSHQTLEKAISAVASALQISGTSADHATRAMRDITEAIAQGGLQGRQFTTILVQVPGVMEAIEQASGKTAREIIGMSNSHKQASATIKTANTEIQVSHDQLTAKLTDNLRKARQNDLALSLSATATAAEQTKAHQKVLTSHTQLVNEQARLSASQQDQYAKTAAAASKSAQQSGIDMLNILANNADALQRIAAGMQLRISQAFTVLQNSFELYVLKVNKATDANGILSGTILAIADHLNVVIPLVGTFVAAWVLAAAIQAVTTITTSLVTLGTNIASATVAVARLGAAALFAFGPWTIAIYALVAAVVTLLAKLGLLDAPLQRIADFFKQGQVAATSFFQQTVDGAAQATRALQTEASAQQGLNSAIAQGNSLVAGGPIISGKNSASIGGGNFIGSGPADPNGSFGGSGSSIVNAGQVTPFFVNPDTSSAARDGGTFIPHFKKGGSFHVPGLGAPDTKLLHLKVSPGEHVTVHTPHQQTLAKKAASSGSHSAHTSPIHHVSVSHHATHQGAAHHASKLKIPHFATGGSLTVGNTTDLVTLGLSGISLTDTQAGQQSVTGFNASTPTASGVATAVANTPTPAPAVPSLLTDTFTNPTPTDGSLTAFTAAQLATIKAYEANSHLDVFRGDLALNKKLLSKYSLQLGLLDTLYFNSGAGSMQIPAFSNVNSLYPDGTESYDLTLGRPIPVFSGFKVSGSDAVPGSSFGGLHARDGLDFSVPGSGAVDSRMLNVAVSPGEQVSVRSPGGQEVGGHSGKTIIQHVNIQASDVDSYNRSKKQILRDLANRMGSAF